jgi:hypothetical protein
MEDVAKGPGSSTQSRPFASGRDAHADLMCMAPAVQPYSKLSPPSLRNPFE